MHVSGGEREFVCAECIEEEYLQSVVRDNLWSGKCDYCGMESDGLIACDLSLLIEVIEDAVHRYYGDPAEEGVPYESAEGGYQLATIYEGGTDILQELGFCPSNWTLFEDIESHFSCSIWCDKDWILLTPFQRKSFAWKRFKEVVTHSRRFTFWTAFDDSEIEGHPDNLPAAQMLAEIAEAIVCADCFKDISTNTELWRVRIHGPDREFRIGSELCTPPTDAARYPNRMSPAGVPMFYGAADFDTAVLETFEPGKTTDARYATGGVFRPCRTLKLLDLISIVEPPSMFAPNSDDLRNAVVFLNSFRDDLIQPVAKDGREHIDYVPTQVFSEFVRYELKHPQGQGLDGIIYPSSRNREPCYVIFSTHEQCQEMESWRKEEQILRFEPASVRTIQLG
jgi:hypothetical protein